MNVFREIAEGDWHQYWKSYNNLPEGDMRAGKEEELYFTVGKTINGEPMSKDFLDDLAEDIVDVLDLTKNDILIELCCGNGLLTKELARSTKHIHAFDFTEHLISMAKERKSAENISYSVNDAKGEFSRDLAGIDSVKFLMNDALGYFSPKELEHIITEIKNISNNFMLYLTVVPNDELKYNFYDTPERAGEFLSGDEWNNGIGKWWAEQEIINISEELNLKYNIRNQKFFNYRMDVLLESK